MLVDAQAMLLGTMQLCQAEQVPHGWHRSPWGDRRQQKCPTA